MLFFRFNTDSFVPLKVEIEKYDRNNRPIGVENVPLDFGIIECYFYKKIAKELSLSVGKITYNNLIGVGYDAFSIDESACDSVDIMQFVFSEYENKPLSELGKSLSDMGIRIEFCKKIDSDTLSKILSSWADKNNFAVLNEEIMWKNMSDDEKADKFSEYLSEIGSENSEIIIIDPYIFSSNDEDYYNLISRILNNSNASNITVITDDRNFNQKCFNRVASNSDLQLSLKYSRNYHDRFWIVNRSKGFCSGTSLNGVGKRISRINYLDDDEVEDIIGELEKESLL